MSDDMTLLTEYVRKGSEEAFAMLVSRHVNLVYSVALREVRDRHVAEEIMQQVFIILARKAKSLSRETVLCGWLCRTARYVSADTVKIERRRRLRERGSHLEQSSSELSPIALNQLEPLLHRALDCLGERDHDAIVLRFFGGKEFKAIGAAMGTTEDAARMRVNRGLEKLRQFFCTKGVRLSAAAISEALSGNSVQSAPAALAAAITARAFSGTTIPIAGAGTAALGPVQMAAIVATLVAIVGAGIYEIRRSARLRDEAERLQGQQAQLVDEIRQLQGRQDAGRREVASIRRDGEGITAELLRVRAEVAKLRRQSAEVKEALEAAAQRREAGELKNSARSLPPVAKIVVTRIKQPQEFSEEQIRTNISIKVGDIYDAAAVDRDVQNLYSTGLFYNLKVARNDSAEGIVLNYVVQEKPRIANIRFAGNRRFSDDNLASLLSSKLAGSFDQRMLNDDVQKIQELYVRSGMADAKVRCDANVNDDVGTGELVFRIAE